MTFSMKGKCACWVDLRHGLLEYRMIGFWTEPEADAFGVEFRRHVDEVSAGGKNRFKVLIEAVHFPAQSDGVREIILKKSMAYSVDHGLEMSARVVSQAITELQFKSLAQEANSGSKVKKAQFGEFYTRVEAMKWLGLPFFPPADLPKET
jgi:hypothetical protein